MYKLLRGETFAHYEILFKQKKS